MTIDEAIEKNRKFCCMNCDKFSCKECKETRNQISDLLEELKSYRASVFSGDMTRTMLKEQYNKAIDDFVAEIEKEYDNDYCPNVSDYLDYEISIRDLFKIAEQLKAGEQNDR